MTKNTTIKVSVEWETDNIDVDLPKEVEIPKEIPEEEIADYLSDISGWLVKSFIILSNEDWNNAIGIAKDIHEMVRNCNVNQIPEIIKDYIENLRLTLQEIEQKERK